MYHGFILILLTRIPPLYLSSSMKGLVISKAYSKLYSVIFLSNYHAVFNVSQVSLERERQHDQTHVQSQLEKLDLLEQEYNRLTTMQAAAEVSECLLLTDASYWFFCRTDHLLMLNIYRKITDLVAKKQEFLKGRNINL